MRSWGAVLSTVTQLIFMTQIPAAPRAETSHQYYRKL